MLEEPRNQVLAELEARVERAIGLIHSLQEEKAALQTELEQYRAQVQERDTRIQALETQNTELQRVEVELTELREKWEHARQEVEREKADIQARLEGLVQMLNGVNPLQEVSPLIAADPEMDDAESETVDTTSAP